MECAQAKTLLGAYIDGELDVRSSLEIEEHVKGCASCARALAGDRALKKGLSSSTLAYRAPAALRRRIVAATAEPAPSRWAEWRFARRPAWSAWRPLALATAFAAAAFVFTSGALHWGAVRRDDRIAQEVVAGHVRSLQADHLTDVLSTDRHTVKPWFSGKLDYSPPVEDLAAEGFPLAGGRLDYLGDRPVSALVYRHGAHTINLFIWPASGAAPARERDERGFRMVRWTAKGMTYWAVSDLGEDELSRFASLLRQRE